MACRLHQISQGYAGKRILQLCVPHKEGGEVAIMDLQVVELIGDYAQSCVLIVCITHATGKLIDVVARFIK